MNINGYFKFFPVGQGLFYGGCISTSIPKTRPFVFVYDCGTEDVWDKYLTASISSFPSFAPSVNIDHLDLVVISHLHKDHFSGVYQLIKTIGTPRRIILPLIEGDRLTVEVVLYSLFIFENNISNKQEIINTFLRYYLEAEQLSSDGSELSFSDIEEDSNSSKSFMITKNTYSSSLIYGADKIWNFDFFTGSNGRKNNSVIQQIKTDILALLNKYNCKSIQDLLKVPGIDTFELLQSIYINNGFKSGYSLNNTSTLLLHYPEVKESICQFSNYRYFNWYYSQQFTASLLTGDTRINKSQTDKLKEALDSLEPCYLATQLPHHGAKDNFETLTKHLWSYIVNGISIVSYGVANKYGHPSKECLHSFSINQLIKVNEYQDYSYRISLSF